MAETLIVFCLAVCVIPSVEIEADAVLLLTVLLQSASIFTPRTYTITNFILIAGRFIRNVKKRPRRTLQIQMLIQILYGMIQPIFLCPVMSYTPISVVAQVLFKVFYFEQVPQK